MVRSDREVPVLDENESARKCRNIVLCFDGTNNSYSSTLTNVIKLVSFLETESDDQICYYQPGVGTYSVPTMLGNIYVASSKLIDAAIATSMDTHVQQGYSFLMDWYRPGDCIYLFGFSRGSTTARALAAMIATVGLLPPGNAQQVNFAFGLYKKVIDDPVVCTEFKRIFSRDIGIHFCGVWDTVSSTGLVLSDNLPHLSQNDRISIFRHAISLDERRVKFIYEPFFPTPDQDCKQIYFAGCHTDVGGGATKDDGDISPRASHVPLRWMLLEAFNAGLLFSKKRLLESPIYVDVCRSKIVAKPPASSNDEVGGASPTTNATTTTTTGTSLSDERNRHVIEDPKETPARFFKPKFRMAKKFPRFLPPIYGEEIRCSSITIEEILKAGEFSGHISNGKDTLAPIHNSFSRFYSNWAAATFYSVLEIIPLQWYKREQDGKMKVVFGLHKKQPRWIPKNAVYHESVFQRASAPPVQNVKGAEVKGKYEPAPGWPIQLTPSQI